MAGESPSRDVNILPEAITSSDDHRSDCRSFGSNCHPWSQSRKISIGVMVDYSANTRPKISKEDEVVVPNAEKVPAKLNSVGDGNCGEGAKGAIQGKQFEGTWCKSSPWVSTRFLHLKQQSLEAIHHAQLSNDLPAGGGMSNSSSGVNEAPRTISFQCFGNQMSVLQCGDAKEKNCDIVSSGSAGKNGPKERVEEVSFANALERYALDKEVVEDKTDSTEGRREALRKKIWDILGSVSSPNKQVSQVLEGDVNTLNPEQNIDKSRKPIVKPRQNSDMIETYSVNPDCTTRRPVTRYLTRKRASSKAQTDKIKISPSLAHGRKVPERNIFSFEGGFSRRMDAAVTVGLPKSYRKKRESKDFKAEAHNIFFPAKANAGNLQQPTSTNKTTKCFEKTSSLGNTVEHFCIYPPEQNNEFVDVENGIWKQDRPQLPVMNMTHQLGNPKFSLLPQHRDREEDFPNSPLKNIVDPHVDPQSPIGEFREATQSFSHSSPQESNHGEQDDHTSSHHSFNSLLASKQDYHESDASTESSDDAEELEKSRLVKLQPDMEDKDAEDRLSESSSEEEKGSKSSMEGSPINEGTEKTSELFGLSGQMQEDGLTNAITLIALALERVKSKIKSLTSKKSAEVLMSVAEGIHLHLQNAESQIQIYVGEVKSLNKSKRKRLDTKFEAQKEHLKITYQKFKAVVDQHIQKSRSTVEMLEAHDREFRGLMEKQKTSQRELLKQVEEAIQTQLVDGERRIADVHKLAKEKVLQLGYVVAECLKEGVLS